MKLSIAPQAPRVVDVVPTLQTLSARDVAGRVAVVIDVLRATSTIVTALNAGAREVRPVATPAEAQARLARLEAAQGGRERLLLGGERLGRRIEGFDLGNSPLEYTPEAVEGKTIFFSTTNGTRTLRRAAGRRGPAPVLVPDGQAAVPPASGRPGGATRVLVASFLNASAVAERLAGSRSGIVMACAGTQGGFSLEDTLLAGFLVDYLERRAAEPVGATVADGSGATGAEAPGDPDVEAPGPCGPLVFRDLARAAAALYRAMAGERGENLARAVVTSDHARYLSAIGFGGDVAYCASLDLISIVPEFARGRVLRSG